MIKETYRDNPNLKRIGVQIRYTKHQLEEYKKCSEDPIYFMKYMKIITLDHGLVTYKPYEYQKKLITTIHENRFSIIKCPRQSGKTTSTVAYILWSILFQDQQNVAILANKGKTSRDILGRLQLAYENLPLWLQQGVQEWNKGLIELENGSKVTADSTSSSAARSGSYNMVVLDEFAFVPGNIAQEFMTSVYPVITAGTKTKIVMVSTPNGMNLFYKYWNDAVNKRNNYVPFEIHWSDVPGRDTKWREETIRNTSERQFEQEFEAQFLGSSNTLISSKKLQEISYSVPITEHDGLKIYEPPVKDDADRHTVEHTYIITVDVSEGKNQDSSAFSVIDITQTPYKQVATYKSPLISPLLLPTVIYNAAKYYNDAHVLIEINNNPQVADTLHQDFEYENILKVFTGNKQPQQLSAGFARGIQMGLKMSPIVKKMGCSNLKTLIETDKLTIVDFDTYSELTTFVSNKTSFAAVEGAYDDMAMTLVIFAWAANQKYFKELVNHDLRKQLQKEVMNQDMEELLPIPLIDDGLDNPFEVMDGAVWENADGGGTYDNFFREFRRKL